MTTLTEAIRFVETHMNHLAITDQKLRIYVIAYHWNFGNWWAILACDLDSDRFYEARYSSQDRKTTISRFEKRYVFDFPEGKNG